MAYYKRNDYDRAIVDYTRSIALKPGFAEAYYNRGEAWLHLGEWDKAKLDLTVAMAMGIDIIHSFRNEYGCVSDFERRNGVKLPADLAAMLTPSNKYPRPIRIGIRDSDNRWQIERKGNTMRKADLQQQAATLIEQLSAEKLKSVIDYLNYLQDKEAWEATHELTSDPEIAKV